MYNFYIIPFLLLLIISTACRDSSRVLERDASDATIASETGSTVAPDTVPADVIDVTKALINGVMYDEPNFESKQITRFDPTHKIYLLDTTGIMFAKARIYKDATTYTGYVSKAILPEKE